MALLFFLTLISCIPAAIAVPPPPPLVCTDANQTCRLTNAYGAWSKRNISCNASRTEYPTTEQQIIDAVGQAAMKRLPVKAVSAFSHTISPWACPRETRGIFISTRNFNRRISLNESARTVTADAGVSLRQLLDHLGEKGWALRASPYWDAASLAGLISTGSHGSSLRAPGPALHNYLVSLTLVRPKYPTKMSRNASEYAEIVRLSAGEADFRAAAVSLGLMGVISTVTLRIEPQFKRNVTQRLAQTDDSLEEDMASFGAAHEFADITWYPSQGRVLFKSDDAVPASAPGDGVNEFIGFRPTVSAVSEALRALEESYEKTQNYAQECAEATALVASKWLVANGYKNNAVTFTGYPVVGYQHKMQSYGGCSRSPASDLLRRCPWDPQIRGLFFFESTVVFLLPAAAAFIADVKRLRAAVGTRRFCGLDLYNGFLIRFLHGDSTAYLGHAEDSVVMDFNYMRARSASQPRMDEDIIEEIEQMAFFKHGGVPHWAKNRGAVFVGAGRKFAQKESFLEAVRRFDPQSLFWNEWAERVFGSGGDDMKGAGCALDGMCVCSEDSHCAPAKGYFCQAGVVYAEARVCRFEQRNASAASSASVESSL